MFVIRDEESIFTMDSTTTMTVVLGSTVTSDKTMCVDFYIIPGVMFEKTQSRGEYYQTMIIKYSSQWFSQCSRTLREEDRYHILCLY